MADIHRSQYTVTRAPLNTLIINNAWGFVDVYVYSAPCPDAVVLHRTDLIWELNHLESDIRMMYEELAHRYPDEPNPKELKKGYCYAIYSTRKRKWLRAKSLEDIPDVTTHGLLVTFHLVDYCVDENLLPNRARFLPDKYCEIPVVGYLACHSDPFAIPRVWAVPEMKAFRDLLSGEYIACKPIKYHPEKQIDMVQFYVDYELVTARRPPRPPPGRQFVLERVPETPRSRSANGTGSDGTDGHAAASRGPGGVRIAPINHAGIGGSVSVASIGRGSGVAAAINRTGGAGSTAGTEAINLPQIGDGAGIAASSGSSAGAGSGGPAEVNHAEVGLGGSPGDPATNNRAGHRIPSHAALLIHVLPQGIAHAIRGLLNRARAYARNGRSPDENDDHAEPNSNQGQD